MPNNPTTRRLLRELSDLNPSASSPSKPNPTFTASPISETDLFEWHFTLLGPPAPSPYAGGLYHGRISLPPTYPLKPPNFRFLTPSGRFEVNREICLSISGFHEETWMPAWGIRTALTALRSFMAEAGTAGQVGGLEASDGVRRRLAAESRGWRCSLCDEGGKTNEERMNEWWDVCRDAGVGVEEGEIRLEERVEGMGMLVKEKEKDKDETSLLRPRRSVQPPPPLIPTPTAEDTQISAEAVLSPSEQSTSEGQRARISNIHAPPVTAANSSLRSALSRPQGQREHDGQRIPNGNTNLIQQTQTITIDRAIAGVFVALCLMVLKKIFYPSATSPGNGYMAFGGGDGDFYLQREM